MKASVKYKVIYRHKDSYSISEMCRFFEVSRSGYYDFVNRLDTPAKDLPLDQMIQQCQEQCRNTYGYRRVHIWLEYVAENTSITEIRCTVIQIC